MPRPVVVVVDDEPGVCAALEVVLEQDYEVLTAGGGPAALEIVKARPVDVVLLDIRMPGMDGFETLARLLAIDPRIEVILVSAFGETAKAVEGIQRGAADYIPKPVDDPVLLTAIRRVLIHRRSRVGGVLLAGADLGRLATLEILLENEVMVATIGPSPDALRLFVERPPAIVVFDAPSDLGKAATFVRSVRESLPATELMVLTSDTERTWRIPGMTTLPVARLVAKTAAFDVLLRCIGERLPREGDAPRPTRPMEGRVLEALEYVAAQYQERLTVGIVARAIGLSGDRLAHIFRDAVGLAVMDYVMRLRLAIARSLLRNPELTLDDVADLAGFADASHLSRVFIEAVGTRPGEYRLEPRAWPAGVA